MSDVQLPSPWSEYIVTPDGLVLHRSTRVVVRTYEARGYLYAYVKRDDGNGGRSIAIHRLVALGFHGKCPKNLQVAHNNGVKADNRPANLRYATREENHADRECHGTVYRGQRAPRAKLKNSQVLLIRQRFALGEFERRPLADEFGVSVTTVNAIIRGERYRSIGGPRFNAEQEQELRERFVAKGSLR